MAISGKREWESDFFDVQVHAWTMETMRQARPPKEAFGPGARQSKWIKSPFQTDQVPPEWPLFHFQQELQAHKLPFGVQSWRGEEAGTSQSPCQNWCSQSNGPARKSISNRRTSV